MVLYEESKYEEAIAPLKRAADQGHLPSAEKLANCYNRSGSSGLAVPYWEICRKANNHSTNTNYVGVLTIKFLDFCQWCTLRFCSRKVDCL